MDDIQKWKIARIILSQSGASHQINFGPLREALGEDGYKAALDLRWIQPDYEFGGVTVSSQAKHIDQMREAAEGQEDAEIGDQVMIADSGKSYTATVSGKNPDGTLKLSFGNEKPSADKVYKKGEFKVLKKGAPAATAQSTNPADGTDKPAATVASGGPAAPGIGT